MSVFDAVFDGAGIGAGMRAKAQGRTRQTGSSFPRKYCQPSPRVLMLVLLDYNRCAGFPGNSFPYRVLHSTMLCDMSERASLVVHDSCSLPDLHMDSMATSTPRPRPKEEVLTIYKYIDTDSNSSSSLNLKFLPK